MQHFEHFELIYLTSNTIINSSQGTIGALGSRGEVGLPGDDVSGFVILVFMSIPVFTTVLTYLL